MNKKKVFYAVFYIAVLLLMVFAFSKFDLESVYEGIKQIPVYVILLLLGLQILEKLLLNTQWYLIAKSAEVNISFLDMIYINCQGTVVDSTIGGKIGGEAARAVLIHKKTRCNGEQAAAIMAVQKLFTFSAFFLLSLFSVSYLIGTAPFLQSPALQIALYSIMVVLLLLFLCIFLFPESLIGFLMKKETSKYKWVLSFKAFLLSALKQMVYFNKRKKVLISILLMSFSTWSIIALIMYFLTIQLYADVNIAYICAVTLVSYLVALIPIFPGGLGGFEGTMIAMLVLAGLTDSDAAALTMLFRFITFWFVALGSLGFAFIYKICKRINI